MGTTSLLISSTLSKKEKKLDHLEREFQKARLELDEKRCLVERKQQLFTQMLEEEYAMAASFLQQQEIDSSCEWENLWQSYRKDRRQLEEEFAQDKVS